MADSDKQILITPNVSQTSQPEIKFVGKDNSPVYMKVLDDNTISFEGSEGQVFSIGPTLSSGDIFSVSDISGVQSMAVNADGTITLDAQSQEVTIKNNASDSATLILENSNADGNRGPILELYRNSASPADADKAGAIIWYGKDDAGNKQELGQMYMYYNDVSSGSEDAELIFQLTEAGGVQQEYMRIRGGSRQIHFNTAADDIDMTWDGDSTADLMFWDAGNERIGINTGTSVEALLHVNGTIQSGEQTGSYFSTLGGNALTFNRNAASYIDQAVANGDLNFRMNGSTALFLDGDLSVGIGTATPMNRLQISHTGADGDNGILVVRVDSATTDTELLGGIGFDSTDGNVPSSVLEASAGIAAYAAEGHGTGDKGGDLVFFTTAIDDNDDTASHERVRVTSEGKVGIGTNDPDKELHVEGSVLIDAYNTDGAGGGLFFREGHLNTNQPSITLKDHSGSNPDGLAISAYDGMTFNLDATAKMILRADGLCIGTSSPSFTSGAGLEVEHATQANVRVTDTSASASSDFAQSENDLYIVNRKTNGDIKIRVNSSNELITLDGGNQTVTFNGEYTFPTADGSANQVLQTDGNGALSFATVSGSGGMTSFQLEDGDGTEVTISDGKEVKFVEGTGIEINWTDTSPGSNADPYDMTFTVDVSDFMSNGSNNRVVTATGTDGMNAEANLHFDGTGLGIGTSAIPHGSKGAAKLAIEGTNQNVAGPHIQTTTASDDYPLLQILSWQHDNISINFDAWYTPTDGWTSSDAGSNYQIYKHSDTLKFRYDSGVSADADITWNDGFQLTTDGIFLAHGGMQGKKTVMKNVSSNTTLADGDSGKTIYWTGGTLTLPATAEAGQQFVIINNTGGSATPGLGTSNAIVSGWTAHAAMDDETARTYISPAANKWLYIG